MYPSSFLRSVLLCLVALVLFPAAAKAEDWVLDRAGNAVRDKDGSLVGSIQGWWLTRPQIVINDGSRRVLLRVGKRHFQTVDIAYFRKRDCTGPAYVLNNPNALEGGINGMQGVVYVMVNSKRLYRTRGSNPAQDLVINSSYQSGGCREFRRKVSAIAADVFVENLFVRFRPPFRVQ